jgi:LacI family transcriptional regulator
LNGYIDALKQAHLPVDNEFIRYGGLHEQDGYESLDCLLKRNTVPDAVFSVNDPVAIGAFQRIREAGLKIPDDVALIGFSNNKITSLIDPRMTTVDQPSFEMGKQAAKLLINEIEDETTQPTTVVVDAKLIIREST